MPDDIDLEDALDFVFGGPPSVPFEGGLLWTAPPQEKPKQEDPATE